MAKYNPAGKPGDWKRFKERMLQDPATRAAYDAQNPYWTLIDVLIELRKQKRLSQREFARLVEMSQPALSRLESGHVQPTWETLARVIEAAGGRLIVEFEDAEHQTHSIPIALERVAGRQSA